MSSDPIDGHMDSSDVTGEGDAKMTQNGHLTPTDQEKDDPSNLLLSAKSKLQHLSDEERDHLNNCLRSRRILREEDLATISQNIDPKFWKEVANALKFNFMAVEKWNEGAESDQQKVFQMLVSWLNWKDEKATVARLAKALFLHDQLEAIECMVP